MKENNCLAVDAPQYVGDLLHDPYGRDRVKLEHNKRHSRSSARASFPSLDNISEGEWSGLSPPGKTSSRESYGWRKVIKLNRRLKFSQDKEKVIISRIAKELATLSSNKCSQAVNDTSLVAGHSGTGMLNIPMKSLEKPGTGHRRLISPVLDTQLPSVQTKPHDTPAIDIKAEACPTGTPSPHVEVKSGSCRMIAEFRTPSNSSAHARPVGRLPSSEREPKTELKMGRKRYETFEPVDLFIRRKNSYKKVPRWTTPRRDTGARASVINETMARRLGWKGKGQRRDQRKISFQGVGSGDIASRTADSLGSIRLEGWIGRSLKVFRSRFHVVSDSALPGSCSMLLSESFCKKHCLFLDGLSSTTLHSRLRLLRTKRRAVSFVRKQRQRVYNGQQSPAQTRKV